MSGTVWLVLLVLCVAALVYAAIEWLGVLTLSPWAFRTGPRLWKGTFDLDRLPAVPKGGFHSRAGHVVAASNGRVVFWADPRPNTSSASLNPRGTLVQSEGRVDFDARLPLGPVLLSCAMILVWIVAAIQVWPDAGWMLRFLLSVPAIMLAATAPFAMRLLIDRVGALADDFVTSQGEPNKGIERTASGRINQ